MTNTNEAPAAAGASPLSGDLLSPAEVAALRHAMGLSLDQMAAMLGVHPRTVRSWESGRDRTSRTSSAAIWALADRHTALVRQMVDAGVSVAIVRDQDADEAPPRGWYLAAAGRALLAGEVEVDWL